MTTACFLNSILHLLRHLVYIKPGFHCTLECTLVFAVMHRWSRSDAIDVVSLGLEEIVNHIQYPGKQLLTAPQRTVEFTQELTNEKEKHSEWMCLMAGHLHFR